MLGDYIYHEIGVFICRDFYDFRLLCRITQMTLWSVSFSFFSARFAKIVKHLSPGKEKVEGPDRQASRILYLPWEKYFHYNFEQRKGRS
jgi:hypothetical protein